MVVFIDLKDQIIEATSEFAFYDTITDKFLEFGGCVTWCSAIDFKFDYEGEDLDRFISKITDKFKI